MGTWRGHGLHEQKQNLIISLKLLYEKYIFFYIFFSFSFFYYFFISVFQLLSAWSPSIRMQKHQGPEDFKRVAAMEMVPSICQALGPSEDRTARLTNESNSTWSMTEWLHMCSIMETFGTQCIVCTGILNGQWARLLIDSGSEINAISDSLRCCLAIPIDSSRPSIPITLANGKP